MARSSDSSFPLSILRDKTFQAREIRRVLALSALYLVITTLMMGVIYHQMIGSLIEGVAPLFFVSEDMQLVNEAVPSLSAVLAKWVISMMIVNFVVTVGLGIYITQKLGHPLMAIKRTLREIGAGNLDVRLRSTDKSEFGEISSELTAAMSSIREQIAAAKHQIDKADEQLDAPQAQAQSAESDEQNVNQSVRNCKLALDFFQLASTENTQTKEA